MTTIEHQKREAMRVHVIRALQLHKRLVKRDFEREGKTPDTADLVMVVLKPGHPKDFKAGKLVNPGWGGEGETTILYSESGVEERESFGGELERGGVCDEEVFAIHVPSATSFERSTFNSISGYRELEREILDRE